MNQAQFSLLETEQPATVTAAVESPEINQGLPPLPQEGPAVSFFEFWPAWVMYAPVVAQWLGLAVRYRSLGLPLIANPGIPLSGMVGESKTAVLDLAGDGARQWILPYLTLERGDNDAAAEAAEALAKLAHAGLSLPVVAKPDMGCRGAGVRLIEQPGQLVDYLAAFPAGARYLLQQKAPHEAEAGVFYVRYPGQSRGKITSITLKYAPFVVGDGKRTLEQLIMADERASQLAPLYCDRHRAILDRVLAPGQAFRLAFAGSHCRGSIFRNGNQYISEALTAQLDAIFDDVPGFHYGRLDIKFADIEKLQAGQAFTIIEINGASSEATHIWDNRSRLGEAFSTLLSQYRTLFEIGHLQRRAGHKVPSLLALYRAWREEKRWVDQYPSTD